MVAAAIIVAAWLFVALAWTPPTVAVQQMMSRNFGTAPPPAVFLYVLLGFVPWMAVTPLLLWLGARFPVSERALVRPILIHILIGIVVVPLATFIGTVLAALFSQHFSVRPADAPALLNATFITSFYSIPTYVAVVAIGQALAYFKRYRARERMLARAELRALEAQLNPHFLFNTLNAISALGYRDPEKADAALTQLSDLLRSALKERPQFVPLRNEIGFVNDYLEIHRLLMPGRMDVQYAIAPAVWEAAVPAMILQPLVENAVTHGIAKLPGGGLLSLAAAREGPMLVLCVTNSLPPSQGASAGAGIGLANVRERLRVLYGESWRLSVERGARDCAARIEIPYSQAQP